jgi:hypothetical protein
VSEWEISCNSKPSSCLQVSAGKDGSSVLSTFVPGSSQLKLLRCYDRHHEKVTQIEEGHCRASYGRWRDLAGA